MKNTSRNKVAPILWSHESTLKTESTLHQISPYIGKMKSSMANALINSYTKPGDIVLDPFVGSGTVALECLISGRGIIASDINLYSFVITKAKLYAPTSFEKALKKVDIYLSNINELSKERSLNGVPVWVKSFFHPKTLREILVLVDIFTEKKEYFLLGCLLGILHHQRPGFLSYPSSHLVPYLRNNKYPKEEFPELYTYREVAPRLRAKIQRVYKRFPEETKKVKKACYKEDASKLQLQKCSIDCVITSPPYMNALDYARDNRLRLWFLGIDEYTKYDKQANTRDKFITLMRKSMYKMHKFLKVGGKCIIVIGDLSRSQNSVNTSDIILNLVENEMLGFEHIDTIVDYIPDIRRSRRDARGTKKEWILVFQKKYN